MPPPEDPGIGLLAPSETLGRMNMAPLPPGCSCQCHRSLSRRSGSNLPEHVDYNSPSISGPQAVDSPGEIDGTSAIDNCRRADGTQDLNLNHHCCSGQQACAQPQPQQPQPTANISPAASGIGERKTPMFSEVGLEESGEQVLFRGGGRWNRFLEGYYKFANRCVWVCLPLACLFGLGFIIVLGILAQKIHGGANNQSTSLRLSVMKASHFAALDLQREYPDSRNIQIYLQNEQGHIVTVQKTSLGLTISAEPIATDGRPGTPIMAVPYSLNEELTWRVYYVNKDNFLAEMVNSNETEGWGPGPLINSRLKVAEGPSVGISACYDPYWYGRNHSSPGIRLYYGSAEGYVQELMYYLDASSYDPGHKFDNSNPFAGVECTVRGLSVTNVWLQTSDGSIQQNWIELNSSVTSRTPGQWTKGISVPAAKVAPNTAISAITSFLLPSSNDTRYFHYQDRDSFVWEGVVTGYAETSVLSGDPLKIGSFLPGTGIACVVIDTGLGAREMHVYAQLKNGEVVESIRTLPGGATWASSSLWSQALQSGVARTIIAPNVLVAAALMVVFLFGL